MMTEYVGNVIGGWNISIAQLWGSGPKLTILCRGCHRGYEKRVAPDNHPRVVCPHCHQINVLDVVVDKEER